MGVKRPYSDAVSSGQYIKKSGLSGKYDNVRRYWEDQVTRLFIRPYLNEIIDKISKKLKRLRVLDLGCGAGDGFDLLMGITAKDVGIYEYEVKLINEDLLGLYLGIDINSDLIKQAKDYYGNNEKMIFYEGDFRKGIPMNEQPFDIYFTSFGTLSHNKDEQTIRLLADIAKHCKENALVVCDWLGRFSYEWQDLWEEEPYQETFIDYKISYIYSQNERDNVTTQSFPLRIISKKEVLNIIKEVQKQSGIQIKVKKIFDRSIFVGRHMDTREYNNYCPPIRKIINSLIEPNVRTYLTPLIVNYMPKKRFNDINTFFEGFSMCWNTLIKETIRFLADFQEGKEFKEDISSLYTFYPDSLKNALETIRKVINYTGDLPGDSRSNIIEPQLAYALRKLEMDMQPGFGIAHGLVGILEINK